MDSTEIVACRQSVPLSEYMRVVQELEAARKSYAQLESRHARVTPPPLTPASKSLPSGGVDPSALDIPGTSTTLKRKKSPTKVDKAGKKAKGNESLDCGTCGEVLKTNKSYQKHLENHKGSKTFTCGDCGRVFKQKSQLQVHARTHTGERPFTCDQCDRSFSHADSLKEHKNLHNSAKPFECDECNLAFPQKKALRNHKNQWHRLVDGKLIVPKNAFTCPFCDRPFTTDKGLKLHKRSAHASKAQQMLGNELNPDSSRAKEISDLPAEVDMLNAFTVPSLTPTTSRSFVEEENDVEPSPEPEQASSISPIDDLMPDSPPMETGNLDDEKSCREQHHGNDATCPTSELENATNVTQAADLVSDDPSLPPIEPRNLDEEEKSCLEQLAFIQEAIQSDRRALENSSNQLTEMEKKMQSLRQKIETTKKNEQITERLLKDLLLKKEEVEEQIKETSIKKIKVELELSFEQCKAIELELIEPVEEVHQEKVASMKKKVQSLEEEVENIENELADLKEQEEAITEDLVDAEECCVGAVQSLSTMKKEVEELEAKWKADADSQNQMVDSSKERIEVYHQLEENRLEIELEKKIENLSKEKTNLMVYLKAQFDE